jgi:SOS-response transcriptional repressor LexA
MGFSRNYISLVEHGREPSHRFEKGLRLIEQAPIPHFQQKSGPFDATPRGMIKARRQELGLSLDELARRTGCQKSMLRNVEEGHNRASESLLRKLSTHLDLPLDDLMDGSDYPHLTEAGRTVGADANIETEPGVKARVIPLLSWAQAGTTQAWEDVYEHEGFIGFNVRDQKAVAVKIRGDSMAPQFPEGTVAIVYPSWEAKSGDLVIARLDDGTVMFKRLHVDGDFYTFISLNPIYPPRTVEKSKVERLLPVGGTYLNQLE